jgi:hypothetical protein
MRSIKDVTLVNVLELDNASEIKSKAFEFWKKHKVILKPEALEQRASELLMVAFDENRNVIATSTYVKSRVKLLNDNWLYQYRCFVEPDCRVLGFDVHLTLKSLQTLENEARSDQDRPVGVFVVVENPKLNEDKIHRAAVWRAYQMYFIGYTSKGYPIRVYYFEGAKI